VAAYHKQKAIRIESPGWPWGGDRDSSTTTDPLLIPVASSRVVVIRPQQGNASIDIHNEVENPASVPKGAWEVSSAICLRG
jgi:hypothetical protein